MTLIVAIEPDRRQANYLSAMVRGKLKAELIIADSADEALRALGSRVPDVILTSALLSPKDDSIVAEWLRTLDAAAAHVQLLTIPVFAPSRPRPQQRVRSMFAALMGTDVDEPAAAPDGCDPAMFAEQCADYLERAREQRATQANFDEPDDVPVPGPMEESEPEEEMVVAMNTAGAAAAAPPPEEFIEFDLSRFFQEPADRESPGVPPPEPAPDNHVEADEPVPAPAGDVWVPPRLGVKRLWPTMEIPEAAPRSAGSSPQPPARRVPRSRRPVQDEWGFFDPEQCGFTALLAKLAEITEGDDPPAKRPA